MKPVRICSKSTLSIITTNRNSTETAPTYTITSSIAMNSAPTNTISPAALKNARISHSTACTGLRAVMVSAAGRDHHEREKIEGDCLDHGIRGPFEVAWRLTVRCIGGKVRGDRAFPAIAVREQFRLVVDQFLARFGRIFEVRPLDHGIDGACLLA